MAKTTVSAKVTGQEPVTVVYDFGADLKEAVTKFGEQAVFSAYLDAATINVQALIRRHSVAKVDKEGKVTAGAKTHTEIQAIVDNYKPGVAAVRKTPVEKIGSLISAMTPEEKKALLASLKAGI